MKLIYSILLFFSFNLLLANLYEVNGRVLEKGSNEPLTGATIVISDDNKTFYTVTGLDGTYNIKNIPGGNYKIQVDFLSYDKIEKQLLLSGDIYVINIDFKMIFSSEGLSSVSVTGIRDITSDESARADEKNADNIKNIVSAKTIDASPDITVANVLQRVSGISLEPSNTGDGQHAILRGMDKRYNYTLVNGIKIPSPDNDNRYVPLDIFPADMLDRLEVTKSLTPDMEGDAIGGVIDMKLKNAPSDFMLKLNIGTGFNTMFFDRPFMDFDRSIVNQQSPRMQQNALSPDVNFNVGIDDFTMDNANINEVNNLLGFPLNQIYGLSIGNRFGERKQFGIIVSASHQGTFRGANSDFFNLDVDRETNLPNIQNVTTFDRSLRQNRSGIHTKMDYQINQNNTIEFYSSFIRLAEAETRTMTDTALTLARSGMGTGRVEKWFRTRQRISNIFINNLSGKHNLNDNTLFDWSVVYSESNYQDPDMTEFMLISERRTSNNDPSGFRQTDWVYDNTNHRGFFRRWRGNSDRDIAAYTNITYNLNNTQFKTGVMHRYKQRDSYFDRYRLGTEPAVQNWNGDVNDNTFRVAIPGSPSNILNYGLYERVTGSYVMAKHNINKLQILGGVRLEHTKWGYSSFGQSQIGPSVKDTSYVELLPSIHFKYKINKKSNLRSSYFRSISRQGYFEVIPFDFYEEDQFREAGNPDLLHVTADNIDFRYEIFPTYLDQFLIGSFVKRIQNPIEITVDRIAELGNRLYLRPTNQGTATNFGFEVDYIKYIKKWGLRTNYTFTQSNITTNKIRRFRGIDGSLQEEVVTQNRPMQGQSAHLGNISLLFNDKKSGTNLQLSGVYTGRRIAFISPYLDNDQWQRAMYMLDFSAEQKINESTIIYLKAQNLLNTPYVLEIPASNEVAAQSEPHLQPHSDRVISRFDLFARTFLFGIKVSI